MFSWRRNQTVAILNHPTTSTDSTAPIWHWLHRVHMKPRDWSTVALMCDACYDSVQDYYTAHFLRRDNHSLQRHRRHKTAHTYLLFWDGKYRAVQRSTMFRQPDLGPMNLAFSNRGLRPTSFGKVTWTGFLISDPLRLSRRTAIVWCRTDVFAIDTDRRSVNCTK